MNIPTLFYYNAFIVVSDGVNNLYGSFFSPIEYFYAWRLVEGTRDERRNDGINTLFTLISGLFNHHRLLDVIKNFTIFLTIRTKKLKLLPLPSILRNKETRCKYRTTY